METKLIKFNGFGDIPLSLVVCNVLRPLNKKACVAITILQKQKKILTKSFVTLRVLQTHNGEKSSIALYLLYVSGSSKNLITFLMRSFL